MPVCWLWASFSWKTALTLSNLRSWPSFAEPVFNCSLYASMSSAEKKQSHFCLQQASKAGPPAPCSPQSSVFTEAGKETSESESPGPRPPSEFTGDGRLGVCGDEVITTEQKAYSGFQIVISDAKVSVCTWVQCTVFKSGKCPQIMMMSVYCSQIHESTQLNSDST